MRSVDKRLVLKIVLLTSIFWICIQFFLLHLLIIPSGDATEKGNKKDPQKQQQQNGLFGRLSGGGAAALLARLGGGGGGLPSLLGEGGKPVRLPANLMADSKAKFGLNQFDVVVSNLISVNRSLPDVRHPSCRGSEQVKMAEKSGLNTSVIIVFHNEAWSTLLRTIHSVLNRSPSKLLQEVILVDDASDRDYLGASLETYVDALGAQVRLLRLRERSGLIRARLAGARVARGSTLTFLDAHCEVTVGWLEPLIVHVFINPHSVVCPAIDVISDTTFEYLQSTEKTWGVFSWDLLFDWDVVSPREELRRHHNPAMPIRTPAMAGGLFLIRRDYFYSLGAYDEGMEVWGGENVEMSLRVWQCGGELLIIPCSRVGHVFRKVSPYSWPGGVTHVLHRNRVRTARVWLDEFIELPFTLDPSLRTFEFGDVSERIALRRRLKCRSFSWYLQNIFPESNIRPHIARLGQIRNPVHELCFDTGGGRKGQVIAAAACRGIGGGSGNSAQQTFSVSTAGELTASVGCLGAQHIHDNLILGQCDGDAGAFQKFVYDDQAKHIVHVYSNLCVRVDTTRRELPLFLDNCATSDEFIWELPPLFHNQTL
ncbi:Polypeptide N-acetylgalactosaminyltransferase 5 [Taenia crassiceps]|uniref:Polypeptide N-acetylgalactosaminyltransferase n=1 Tax=Taenia crassiceps TaxID=6207 RepID=A0ABR4QKW5_9CEST